MSVWKDKPSGTWKFTFQLCGKVYGGGGYKTKNEARTGREEKRARIKEELASPPKPKTPTTDMAFENLADLYLDGSRRRHADKTFKYKRFVYANFLKHVGEDLPVSQITPYIVQDYLRTRHSNSNYNRHRKDLGALFTYARRVLGVIPVNPCDVIEKLPEDKEKKPKKIPTQEEFMKLISATDEEERPLLMVLAYTLARIDEALRLRWEDVNFERAYIRLWTRKTKSSEYRSRDIPMKDYMKSVMRELWDTRTQDEWVFLNKKTGSRFNRRPKLMAAICKRAGIPTYGFHAIRHFVSSYLLDREKIGKPTVGHDTGTSKSVYDRYLRSLDQCPLGRRLNGKGHRQTGRRVYSKNATCNWLRFWYGRQPLDRIGSNVSSGTD